jgi:hypothetical protein
MARVGTQQVVGVCNRVCEKVGSGVRHASKRSGPRDCANDIRLVLPYYSLQYDRPGPIGGSREERCLSSAMQRLHRL